METSKSKLGSHPQSSGVFTRGFLDQSREGVVGNPKGFLSYECQSRPGGCGRLRSGPVRSLKSSVSRLRLSIEDGGTVPLECESLGCGFVLRCSQVTGTRRKGESPGDRSRPGAVRGDTCVLWWVGPDGSQGGLAVEGDGSRRRDDTCGQGGVKGGSIRGRGRQRGVVYVGSLLPDVGKI